MSLEFTTKKKNRAVIDFKVDDHEYHFNSPKTAIAFLPTVLGDVSEIKAGLDWLEVGLGKKGFKVLVDRLMDKDDDFDLEDLEPIITGLIEAASGNPTT